MDEHESDNEKKIYWYFENALNRENLQLKSTSGQRPRHSCNANYPAESKTINNELDTGI